VKDSSSSAADDKPRRKAPRDAVGRSPGIRQDATVTPSTQDVRALVHELRTRHAQFDLQSEEVRRIQLELAAARDSYAEIYDFAPVGYLALDRSGRVGQANLAAARMIGVERRRLLHARLASLMNPGHAECLRRHLGQVFSEGHAASDLQLVRADGKVREMRLVSWIPAGDQRNTCWNIVSDITELKEAQEVIRRSERLASLGTLIAGIAHEINNPLWMISLQTALALSALDKPRSKATVAAGLREIQGLVERAAHIVESVLRSSKKDASRKWPSSLVEVLMRARDFTRLRADKNGVIVAVDASAGLPQLLMNPTEMEQVFINLLNNAIDASNRGGRIRLRAEASESTVNVSVQDQGCGMSSEEVQRMFDPFFTRTRGKGGTGLGLSVTHAIVQAHHGTISVVSQPGRGTTVKVELPLAIQADEEPG
jgi:PAS domain S-box-containing protein